MDADGRKRCLETTNDMAVMEGFSPAVRVLCNTALMLLGDVDKLIDHIKDLKE